jgi:hypothetical protein
MAMAVPCSLRVSVGWNSCIVTRCYQQSECGQDGGNWLSKRPSDIRRSIRRSIEKYDMR